MYTFASPKVNGMINAARMAGKFLVRDFYEMEKLHINEKTLNDFVTSADLRSEAILIRELTRFKPDYAILSEEKGFIEGKSKNYSWVIDPLDGTSNFIHGVPFFTISIGLRKGNDIECGVIYEPLNDNFFWAERGKGAYLNNTRLRVSNRKKGAMGVIEDPDRFKIRLAYNRELGCASLELAYIAAGKFDIFVHNGLMPWDIAAAVCIIKEAGGKIDDFVKEKNVVDSGNVLAGNPYFFDEVRKGQGL